MWTHCEKKSKGNEITMEEEASTSRASEAMADPARLEETMHIRDSSSSKPFNPQQFIDDVINAAHDILEDAFDVMEENAPRILRISNETLQEDLRKGFDAVYNLVQEKLDKNLCRWEAYTLANCFAIPDKLAKSQENILKEDSSIRASARELDEEQVDAELQAVRSKLAIAGKEVAKMRRELRSLDRCLAVKNKQKEALQEAAKELDEDGEHATFEEVIKTAEVLRMKLNELKAQRVQSPRGICLTKDDLKNYQLQDLTDIANSLEPLFSAKYS